MFKIADPDQWENAHIGPDLDPADRIGTPLVVGHCLMRWNL